MFPNFCISYSRPTVPRSFKHYPCTILFQDALSPEVVSRHLENALSPESAASSGRPSIGDISHSIEESSLYGGSSKYLSDSFMVKSMSTPSPKKRAMSPKLRTYPNQENTSTGKSPSKRPSSAPLGHNITGIPRDPDPAEVLRVEGHKNSVVTPTQQPSAFREDVSSVQPTNAFVTKLKLRPSSASSGKPNQSSHGGLTRASVASHVGSKQAASASSKHSRGLMTAENGLISSLMEKSFVPTFKPRPSVQPSPVNNQVWVRYLRNFMQF